MNNKNLNPIEYERANERLRQERETFEQRKRHDHRWSILRLVMGYSSILLLGAIMYVSTYILFLYEQFPTEVVLAASVALFTDLLGLFISVYKIVLNPASGTKLEPVTKE